MVQPYNGKEMSFWDHLDELRGCIIRSAVAVFVLSIPALVFGDFFFDRIVLAPTKEDFLMYSLTGLSTNMSLINTDVTAQFFLHLKMAFASGLVLAFPYVIYQLWGFVAPALYENERKAVGYTFKLASVLFYLGVAVGYFFVLPVCVSFFMNYSISDMVENTITLSSYLSLFTSMVLVIGLVFEFPTVIMILSRLGLVYRQTLKKYRKHAFVVMLVISALVTPSDPVSMLVLAAPLYLLYEGSIFLCKSKD